ncbi:MAG: EF-hand domain-containing protein [Desulfobacteraceae bacterium]|nr:EF-hand domain-containing protein [Desulfobacteraceae bacterium]
MVGSIGSTNNLISMISTSYHQSQMSSTGSEGVGVPPPPPPPTNSGGQSDDPLGVFSRVDSDSDNSISESEYNTLTEGILEVTGNELTSSFVDFDTDGDGQLNGAELRSVLDEAGFAPPPPPQQVIASYEAQNGEASTYEIGDETMLAQLLEYLETRSGDLDITA